MNEPNGEIKIEKGIPIPSKHAPRDTWANLFRSMGVGDSVLMTDVKSTSAAISRGARYSAPSYKFTCRKVEGGVRVWRVS